MVEQTDPLLRGQDRRVQLGYHEPQPAKTCKERLSAPLAGSGGTHARVCGQPPSVDSPGSAQQRDHWLGALPSSDGDVLVNLHAMVCKSHPNTREKSVLGGFCFTWRVPTWKV